MKTRFDTAQREVLIGFLERREQSSFFEVLHSRQPALNFAHRGSVIGKLVDQGGAVRFCHRTFRDLGVEIVLIR